jgi:hypothetical protein
VNAEKSKLYLTNIQTLINAGLTKEKKAVQDLIKKYIELNQIHYTMSEIPQTLQKRETLTGEISFGNIDSEDETAYQNIQDLMDNMNSIVTQGMQNLTFTFAEGIGDLLTDDFGMEDFGKKILNVIGQFLKQMGEALIVYAEIMIAFKTWAKAHPVGAIILGISAIAAGQILMNLAKGPTGLANGGLIPSGYPNDSYPAMLSSNEAVIPLDKYEFNGGNTNINVQIEGVARGEDIYYVVKEVERKHKNSF